MTNTQAIEITTQRVSNGQFDVFANGEKTNWKILNGDLGSSGLARNMYGIKKDSDAPKWIGSLSKCKKTIALSIKKKGE